MRTSRFPAEALSTLLRKRKMATMPELMDALGTGARRTVFRKLGELKYRTSYSHRGRFYTLDEVAKFDQVGLWSCGDVWFSVHGTLVATCTRLVEAAESGYLVDELDGLLHVSTRDALRKLVEDDILVRERVGGHVLYCASNDKRRAQQLLSRRAALAEPSVAGPLPEQNVMPDELRAAIVLFFSLLDEKLRRLYAGLEALKIGRGGNARIAALLGLDTGTVARGRQDLLRQDVELERVRRTGAGRSSAEKKRRKSSRASKN